MSLTSQFLRFAAVGTLGTATHYGVLITLVELGRLDYVVATTLGFVAGAIVNYHLNRSLTFKSTVAHRSGLPKFLSVATVGMLLNATLMFVLVEYAAWHYIASQILATGLVLFWNFMINRIWTFADAIERSG